MARGGRRPSTTWTPVCSPTTPPSLERRAAAESRASSRPRRSLASSPRSAPSSASRSAPRRCPDARLAPRAAARLPEAPKQEEIEAELERFGSGDPLAIRNRALAELVYSRASAARRPSTSTSPTWSSTRKRVASEARAARSASCPLGEEAAYWVALWLRERPKLARGAHDALFISARGRRLRHEHAPEALPTPAPPPARLRDAPAGGRCRPEDDPGAARPQLAFDHADRTATSTRSASGRSMTAPTRDPELEGFLALSTARLAPRTVEAYRRDLEALARLARPTRRRLSRPRSSSATSPSSAHKASPGQRSPGASRRSAPSSAISS